MKTRKRRTRRHAQRGKGFGLDIAKGLLKHTLSGLPKIIKGASKKRPATKTTKVANKVANIAARVLEPEKKKNLKKETGW